MIERAVFHTESAGKENVDVADILVSIFDESSSHGSFYLRREGLERVDLLEVISHGVPEWEEDELSDDYIDEDGDFIAGGDEEPEERVDAEDDLDDETVAWKSQKEKETRSGPVYPGVGS